MIVLGLVTALCILGDSMLYIVLPIYWREGGIASLWEVGLILSVNRWLPRASLSWPGSGTPAGGRRKKERGGGADSAFSVGVVRVNEIIRREERKK